MCVRKTEEEEGRNTLLWRLLLMASRETRKRLRDGNLLRKLTFLYLTDFSNFETIS
jgi:hypothetical protein